METPLSRKALHGGAMMALSSALTLFGYECVRSSTSTLLKADYGVGVLPWVMALVPVAVALGVAGYGAILSLAGPRRTLAATMGISAAALLMGYAGVAAGFRPSSVFLYLVREAYVVLLIEQYWSFLNSTLQVAQAKRWNGPIIGLSSLGAVAGAETVHRLSVSWGTPAMVALGAAALLPAICLGELAYRRAGEPAAEESHRHRGPLRLALFRESSLLRWLFVVVILSQTVSTVVGISFETALQEAIPQRDLQNAYSGRFYALLNGAAAALQFVVAPLMLAKLPLGPVLGLLPLVNLGCALWLVFEPSLLVSGVAYFVFKAFDYSLMRAGKEVLYIPLSFDVRYRAKEVIDAFGYRLGKGGSSLALGLVQGAGAALPGLLGWISAGACLLWLGGIRAIFRRRTS